MGTKKKSLIIKALFCLGIMTLGLALASCQTYTIPDEVRRVPEEAQAPGGSPNEDTEGTSVKVYYFDKANQRMVAEEYPLQVFLNRQTLQPFVLFPARPAAGRGRVGQCHRSGYGAPWGHPEKQYHSPRCVLHPFMIRRILVAARVALVNTYTGLEGIDYVQISVGDQDLVYPEGDIPVGTMERYPDDLNQVREQDREKLLDAGRIVERELYFRDIYGQFMLTEVRTIYLNENDERPLSSLLIDALAQGPLVKGLYPVVPGNIQVLDAEIQGDAVTLYMSRSFIGTEASVSQPELSDLSIRGGVPWC